VIEVLKLLARAIVSQLYSAQKRRHCPRNTPVGRRQDRLLERCPAATWADLAIPSKDIGLLGHGLAFKPLKLALFHHTFVLLAIIPDPVLVLAIRAIWKVAHHLV